MTRHNADERPARGARAFFGRGLHWPVLVGIVFVSNMGLAAWVIVAASSDPSFAVEDDYYEKALNWNDEIDQRARNAALGWTVSVEGRALVGPGGACELRLRIADRQGVPVSGAGVSMEAMAIARGDDVRAPAFDEVLPGVYGARIDGAIPGRWELRVRAERGEDVFTQRLTTMIGNGR